MNQEDRDKKIVELFTASESNVMIRIIMYREHSCEPDDTCIRFAVERGLKQLKEENKTLNDINDTMLGSLQEKKAKIKDLESLLSERDAEIRKLTGIIQGLRSK